MAKNQKKKDEETVSQGGDQVPAADQQTDSQLRYVGKTIKHFDHQGKIYQLIPNTVYLNLPSDAEQVKRLIAFGELKEV